MEVLLVDDSSARRSLIREQLNTLDVDAVIEAADSPQALSSFAAQRFDLVVCGWNSSTMDGLTLLRTIRRVDAGVPVVLIVDEKHRARMSNAIRFGCSDYLVAPFAVAALRDKLEKWVGTPV